MWILLVVPIALYLLYVIAMTLGQRGILFPAGIRGTGIGVEGIELIEGVTAVEFDGCPAVLFAPPTLVTDSPILIVAHGNAEIIEDWFDLAEAFNRAGSGVLLVEYPGYGGAPGKPGRDTIGNVFEQAYDWLRTEQNIEAKRIFGLGRSIGTGVIGDLSLKRDLAGMILVSPLSTVDAMAKARLIPPFVIRHRFDNITAVEEFAKPCLIIHGIDDQIIPAIHGKAVADTNSANEFVALECGHNDVPFGDQMIERIRNYTRGN